MQLRWDILSIKDCPFFSLSRMPKIWACMVRIFAFAWLSSTLNEFMHCQYFRRWASWRAKYFVSVCRRGKGYRVSIKNPHPSNVLKPSNPRSKNCDHCFNQWRTEGTMACRVERNGRQDYFDEETAPWEFGKIRYSCARQKIACNFEEPWIERRWAVHIGNIVQ